MAEINLMNLIYETIPKISGDDWEVFEESWAKFEYLKTVEGDAKVLKVLPLFLGKRLLDKWLQMDGSKLKNLPEARKFLEVEISNKPNPYISMARFFRRDQGADELVRDYFNGLKKLLMETGDDFKGQVLDKVLCDRFVAGLLPELREMVQQPAYPKTAADALKRAEQGERAAQVVTKCGLNSEVTEEKADSEEDEDNDGYLFGPRIDDDDDVGEEFSRSCGFHGQPTQGASHNNNNNNKNNQRRQNRRH